MCKFFRSVEDQRKFMTVITIIGLGPGSIQHLTLEAYDCLSQAARQLQPVHFRIPTHPTIEPLRQRLPDLRIESFDHIEASDQQSRARQIAQEICALAQQQPVLYAVPGHPFIDDPSVPHIQRLADEQGISLRIIAGLSYLEIVCTALDLDPFEQGTQLIDAPALSALRQDELAGKLIPTVPLLITGISDRSLANSVRLALAAYYPDMWPVQLVCATDVDGEEQVISLPLSDLERDLNHLSALYVPPVDELTALRLPETLRYIIMRLRRDPDGCPWDREHTHQSLTRYVIEEAYEVVETLEENDMEKLAEELGDLLLQVYLHAEIARQEGDFSLGDVFEHINAKMIRRHPHVFGNVEVNGSGQVVQNWEAIKRQERADAGKDVERESVLDRVPLASPALTIAQEYQKRVARIGFEFPSIEEVYAKLAEELAELRAAQTGEEKLEEIGDLLFMTAKLARSLKIDAEEALRRANRKFRRRFQTLEAIMLTEGCEPASAEEWLKLWNQAKALTIAQP